MDLPPLETEQVKMLRQGYRDRGRIFWVRHDVLAVMDAAAAQRLELANFSDLSLLDGFADVVRGRKSRPMSWAQIRAAWAGQMRIATAPAGIRELAARMDDALARQAGRLQDLAWLAARVSAESLVPVIISGLGSAAQGRLLRDLRTKMRSFLWGGNQGRIGDKLMLVARQMCAGVEVRRELRGRARGSRPRQRDLADALLDLMPQLGIDRAVDAVATLLAAISSSPPSAAACLVYELSRQHCWRERLEAELTAISPAELHQSPMRAAPITGRFIKETLRMWGSPLIAARRVTADIRTPDVSLESGQHYVLSGYMLHHDPEVWPEPDCFDPDRWLPQAPRGARPDAAYVPFGWQPTSCIGASLGMAQLVVLTQLLCTRFRVTLSAPERVRIALSGIIMPESLLGVVKLRRAE